MTESAILLAPAFIALTAFYATCLVLVTWSLWQDIRRRWRERVAWRALQRRLRVVAVARAVRLARVRRRWAP